MRALVTGVGGFLGRYIAEQLLARGDWVRGIGRREYPELSAMGVECLRVDLRDRDAVVASCEGVDTVFHTAAIAGIWGKWDEFFQINTQGTEHVLSGCFEHGVGRFVYTSSPSVTFDGTDQCYVDESAPYPTRWLCHYPHTKALAEQRVLQNHGRRGLATCALRPHLIWGPRDMHLIPRLIARARQGRLRKVGAGKNLIDMVYVENAAAAHLQAADHLAVHSAVGGRAYFISQGEPVNCWDWINSILQLAGMEPVQKGISFRTAYGVGGALECVYRMLGKTDEPPMTRFLAAQLATSHYFNIDRARRDFGYFPQISSQQGMQRLGAWLTACETSLK